MNRKVKQARHRWQTTTFRYQVCAECGLRRERDRWDIQWMYLGFPNYDVPFAKRTPYSKSYCDGKPQENNEL